MIRICALAAFALSIALPAAASADLSTVAERSGFQRTGRYQEVIELCEKFAAAYPQAVRCFAFGTTPQGRPMQAMAISTSGALTAQAAHARNLPVLLIQGGIHAGEIDGKDAGFHTLRRMLDGQTARGALDAAVVVFVPVFNVDGHENFRAWNRPNQRGPEEMGFRTTAQRYNLNRDYIKADAPEMQAMLGLVNEWDPIVTMDLHATDGAQFQHDISVIGEPVYAGDAQLRGTGRGIRDGLIARLRKAGSDPVDFYPSFQTSDDPATGFAQGVAPPRFSHGYFVQRNRIGILIETHSWKDYPTRVRITGNTISALTEMAARDGKRWLADAEKADAASARLAGQTIALTYQATQAARTIDFKGYVYTRTPSEISGALMTRYDESRPQVWRVPLRDEVVPDLQVTLPLAGYVVPPEYAAVVEPKLRAHGLAYRELAAPLAIDDAEVFRPESAQFAAQSSEGRQRVALTGTWQRQPARTAARALYVPIAQPKARIVAHLLEPQAPDSLAAWGEFNNAFEQKEYMEDYVAEDVAQEMLARDAALKAQFEQRVKTDAAFAKDAAARLDFFYRRHPAYDGDYMRYPVIRVDREPR